MVRRLAPVGPEAFVEILSSAVDALEFKVRQVLAQESAQGVEGRRRAVEAILQTATGLAIWR